MTRSTPSTPPPGHRPLTARSVLASALLGEVPPRLPVAQLVRLAAAFDINENRARVALSRMAATGEVAADDGVYELVSPALLARQTRLRTGRSGTTSTWNGGWLVAIIGPTPTAAARRAERRVALRNARFGEFRDGVWVRPDNLGNTHLDVAQHGHPSIAEAVLLRATTVDREAARSFEAAIARMWDLDSWATVASNLHDRLDDLDPTDQGNLAPCFELSAACLRHLQIDPLLPTQLLPKTWPGSELRARYARWDKEYRAVLRSLR